MTPILDPEAQRDHAWRNLAHTGLLLGGIGLLLAVSSAMIWGWIGVICTLAAVAILFLTSPRIPPEMVMRLYSAVPVDASTPATPSTTVERRDARLSTWPV